MFLFSTILALWTAPAVAQEPEPAVSEETEPVEEEAPEKPTPKERAEAIGGPMSGNDYGNVSPEMTQRGLGEEAEEEEEKGPEEGEPPEEALPVEPGEPPETEPSSEKERVRVFGLDDAAETVDLYGSFRSHIAVSQGRVEIQNNSSRFGIRAGATIPEVATLYARGEWGVRFGASSGFNVDANAGTLGTEGEESPFFTRLGVIGIDAGKFGELSFGKQWGVYYDVSRMTDRFIVFGTRGSSTFNFGTDGGQTGVGRASNALAYRLKLFRFRVGGQVQFFADRQWIADTWCVSARYEARFGLTAGVAFNDARLGDAGDAEWIEGVDGERHAWAFTAALSLNSAPVYAAVLYARTGNHELQLIGPEDAQTAYFYDTDGVEVYFEYLWAGIFGPHVGYQASIPRGPPDVFDPKFAVHQILYGLRAQFYRFAMAYVEGSVDLGRDVEGDLVPAVLTIGVRVDFSSERALRAALKN